MSFKREGDDGSQLNVLKKRRVADLLASYIPEDEALLLKNGQYACTVCHHRPVFDTIDMLSVHRRGKKHIAYMQRFYGKKAAHRNAVQKRQHEEYVRAEKAGEQPPAPLLEQTKKITQHALLKAAPYNSCCSRNRSLLIVNSGPCRDSLRHCYPVPTIGKADISISNRPEDVRRKEKSSKTEEPPQSLSSPQSSTPISSWPVLPQTAAETSCPEPRSGPTGICKQSQFKKNFKNKKKTQKSSESGEDPSDDPERRRVMEHYLSLRSSGWVPDGTGKWVKDENVEFDSDEEEPPAMPPP
ncbi:sodium channel modifier 1 isoform X1 [Dendropsophus ebraccatus]|uniref:sodium channel modifier 1 isoform X1 n=1 Tax=Dendropsophus ebraccatus TaxID=150705 RepID=UPI0038319D17